MRTLLLGKSDQRTCAVRRVFRSTLDEEIAMESLLTPASVARTTPIKSIDVPDYCWEKQVRGDPWGETPMAGNHTERSVQTFDSHGKPKDANGDKND